MSNLISFGRVLLFFLSMSGYLLYMLQKYQIPLAFGPAFFTAWASNLLFAGGILNILPQTAWLIFMGGFVLLAMACRSYARHKTTAENQAAYAAQKGAGTWKRECLLYAVFLAGAFYFLCLLWGARYTGYDNFSHWATVVRDMLIEERMPNFADPIIRFQSYPLGSSLFIYYVCKIVGSTDACLLWAQAWMLLSFLFCLTAFLRKTNWFGTTAAVCYGVWALTVNNHLYELRVDTLLPLTGVAAFAVIYYYKAQPRRALAGAAGLFMLLINIKNSGCFFYAACVLFLLVYTWDYSKRHKIYFANMALVLPLSMLYFWKRHVALVFPDGMSAKHSMSMENFEAVFAKKTADDILQIAEKMLVRLRSLDSVEVGMMLLITALFGMLIFCRRSGSRPVKSTFGMLAAMWACFAAYLVSMFGMYLFSMPLGESLRLASYERYLLSVFIFIYGITVIYLANEMVPHSLDNTGRVDKEPPIKKICAVLLTILLCCPLLQVREKITTLVQKPDFASTKRCSLQKTMRQNAMRQGESCFIYCNGTDDDARYLFYLSRYEFWSPQILVVNQNSFAEKKNEIPNYDYLLVWDTDEQMDDYLAQNHLAEYQGKERAVISKARFALPL